MYKQCSVLAKGCKETTSIRELSKEVLKPQVVLFRAWRHFGVRVSQSSYNFANERDDNVFSLLQRSIGSKIEFSHLLRLQISELYCLSLTYCYLHSSDNFHSILVHLCELSNVKGSFMYFLSNERQEKSRSKSHRAK